MLQRQAVARQDVDGRAGNDDVADLQPDGLQDVPLLAVGIGHQRDARRAIRVVLDCRHPGRDVALVAPEIDHAVLALVTATPPPRGEFAVIVAPTRLVQRLGQRLVRLGGRDLVERGTV